MANVIIGTDLKSLVKIDRIGQYEMKDMDFTIDVVGTKTITFTKEECVPENNGTDGYNAIGKIKELESLVAALRAKVGI